MPISLTILGKALADALLASLKPEGARISTLAQAEARKLAIALTEVAGLLARGEIDAEEAAMLLRVQRDASEAVLASLVEVGRVAAGRALAAALASALPRLARSPVQSLVAGLLPDHG